MPTDPWSTEIEFDEWLRQFFDRGEDESLILADDIWYSESNPRQAVELMTQLWSKPIVLLERYSIGQIGKGLWHLAGVSEYSSEFYEQKVPLPERVRAILAIETLNRELFARICEPALSHLDRARDNHANGACYMFWDIIHLIPRCRADFIDDRAERRSEYEQIEEACLKVMENCLNVPHIAVQEGTLHGLGHWKYYLPERVESIIDRFLASEDLDPELHRYAQQARTGYIN